MRIAIKDVKALAKKFGLSHVIILGWDGTHEQVATYGTTVEACAASATQGNNMKRMLGWPESLCTAEPSRVKKLQQRIKELESELTHTEKVVTYDK